MFKSWLARARNFYPLMYENLIICYSMYFMCPIYVVYMYVLHTTTVSIDSNQLAIIEVNNDRPLIPLQKKGKKGKKGKKEKGLTPDRTIESLYEELAKEGIVTRCPKVRLSEFIGDHRYTKNECII